MITGGFEIDFQAEAAASAGERAVRGFMVAVYRATSNVASVQQVSCHHPCMKTKIFDACSTPKCPRGLRQNSHMIYIYIYMTSSFFLKFALQEKRSDIMF